MTQPLLKFTLMSNAYMRSLNYANCDFYELTGIWWTCTPKYAKADNITYYSFVGNLVSGDIGARTATYPWNADCIPFPCLWNVDRLYPFTHGEIKSDRLVFDDAIALIDGTPPLMAASQEKSQQSEQTAASLSSSSSMDEQIVLQVIETINASGVQTESVYVDSGSDAFFNIYSTEPLSFTIKTPAGTMIDPTAATNNPDVTYQSEQGDGYSDEGWWYRYHVANPQTGALIWADK